MPEIKTLSFPISQWEHLYSLQQAISHQQQLNGCELEISGCISNHDFLQKNDTPVSIKFLLVDSPPNYSLLDSKLYELGVMTLTNQQLETEIKIERAVFEELRKNLMEYGEIDGIHIIVTLGLLCDAEHWAEHWAENKSLQIVQLDYAMKGDA
ncbi:hypothetical protein MNBD_GAMMA08-2192 [hydrothermal vent metagenome]|uniref:Uncharacterized protein n=1 Tax=hydrothermal vent metagenome TaxID=652676 RepID=A0A3B0YET8_9ZZZZ